MILLTTTAPTRQLSSPRFRVRLEQSEVQVQHSGGHLGGRCQRGSANCGQGQNTLQTEETIATESCVCDTSTDKRPAQDSKVWTLDIFHMIVIVFSSTIRPLTYFSDQLSN